MGGGFFPKKHFIMGTNFSVQIYRVIIIIRSWKAGGRGVSWRKNEEDGEVPG